MQALLIVDLQNDFCPGGSLAVPGANDIIPLVNQLQAQFDLVIATQDWHPANHVSFAQNHANKKVGDIVLVDNIPQILWPVHCVQHTKGAEFHPALNTEKLTKIIHKGVDPGIDSYSAFFDNEHLRSTELHEYLSQLAVSDLYIVGVATDYCVKYTTLDALRLGYRVFVLEDACRGVDLMPGDVARAWAEIREAGAVVVSSRGRRHRGIHS